MARDSGRCRSSSTSPPPSITGIIAWFAGSALDFPGKPRVVEPACNTVPTARRTSSTTWLAPTSCSRTSSRAPVSTLRNASGRPCCASSMRPIRLTGGGVHGREPEAGVRQPNSGTSAGKVVASTGPTPGTLTSNCSCSRHAGRRCISSLSVRFHALQLPAQPDHVGPDLLLHPQRGARQPVLFGRHHLHELAAPCQPVLQLLGQGIRQRPDRAAASRPRSGPGWPPRSRPFWPACRWPGQNLAPGGGHRNF